VALVQKTTRFSSQHNQPKPSPPILEELGALSYVLWQIALKREQVVVSKPDLLLLIHLCGYESNDIRLHAVGVLNYFAQLPIFANDKDNYEIGKVLLKVIENALKETNSGSLEVLLESLNALIDIYSEDNLYLSSIQELKLLQCLTETLSILKRKATALEKVKDMDEVLYGRLMECLTNLDAFIRYKKQHP